MIFFVFLCSLLNMQGNLLVKNSQLNIFLTKKDAIEERMSSKNTTQPELILYYSPSCPFCKKVLKYLAEKNPPISLKNVSIDPIAKEELYHIGGKVQVPCLFIDGTPLYESQDIIDWLKDHSATLN